MNQQINLYLPEFRIKKDPISVELMAKSIGAALVVMITITGWDLYERWQLQGELESLRITLTEETRKTSELDDQLARRSQDTDLIARLDEAEARYESSLQIREFLGETQLGNVVGFSEFFKDLSRAAIDGLAITQFEFTNGGEQAVMVGQVVDSAIVPRYVDNIENGVSPLRSKTFSPAITRSEDNLQLFNFELSTTNE